VKRELLLARRLRPKRDEFLKTPAKSGSSLKILMGKDGELSVLWADF